MGIEGRLNIGLRSAGRRIAEVTIHSNRPVHASRVFHGKGADEALQMLPMLFSICGTAQACAGVRACEQALGHQPADDLERLEEPRREPAVELRRRRGEPARCVDEDLVLRRSRRVVEEAHDIRGEFREPLALGVGPVVPTRLPRDRQRRRADVVPRTVPLVPRLVERRQVAVACAEELAEEPPPQLARRAGGVPDVADAVATNSGVRAVSLDESNPFEGRTMGQDEANVDDQSTADEQLTQSVAGPPESGLTEEALEALPLPDPDHPVVAVSWRHVRAFYQCLNEAAGQEMYRLPTEAEWEYACRAGTATAWSFGNDEGQLQEYAWYRDGMHAVGLKRPNPWGLYDMYGNAMEWVQDWYDRQYYAVSPDLDPLGPMSGSCRVQRGGSAGHSAGALRSAFRFCNSEYVEVSYMGGRLLREGP